MNLSDEEIAELKVCAEQIGEEGFVDLMSQYESLDDEEKQGFMILAMYHHCFVLKSCIVEYLGGLPKDEQLILARMLSDDFYAELCKLINLES